EDDLLLDFGRRLLVDEDVGPHLRFGRALGMHHPDNPPDGAYVWENVRQLADLGQDTQSFTPLRRPLAVVQLHYVALVFGSARTLAIAAALATQTHLVAITPRDVQVRRVAVLEPDMVGVAKPVRPCRVLDRYGAKTAHRTVRNPAVREVHI